MTATKEGNEKGIEILRKGGITLRDSKEQKAIADEIIAILKKHNVTIGELTLYLAYNPLNDTAVIGTADLSKK